MNTEYAAQLAMTANFATLIFASARFVAPWLRRQSLGAALAPLLLVHTGRTIALQLYSAQYHGFPIPDSARNQIVWGDQLGFALALAALVALWLRPEWAKAVTWLLVAETVLDLGNALRLGLAYHLLGTATDLSWLILTFYVPVLWVSTGLMVWLLVIRRAPATASR